ncbi:MAG: hypothetical protein LBK24_01625 [Puniceicoccales bacterium]|jgi:hypothetical protein|nr:hypothetical protein [Puniceicoccales bacterium]
MDRVDRATDHGVDARRETLALGDEKSPAATTLHGAESSPSSRPLGIRKDATVPFHPLSLREVEAPVPEVAPRATPQQILEDGIRKAYFGRTDGIDDASWAGVSTRLETMSFKEARGVLQPITNVIAVDCFNPDGNIDIGRVRGWIELFENAEIFGTEPCRFIPHAKFACSQICVVLKCLYDNRNDARDKINAASHNPAGLYGQSILDIMFPGVVSPFNPSIAIRYGKNMESSSHAENIDIDALLALDPNNMESGKAYAIGDRNWGGYDMSRDIPRLAVRKIDATPPTYEFGTLRGSTFAEDNTLLFMVYNTSIEKHDAEYWEQFNP